MVNSLPLVSIIVPVYNVQLYVERCLDSLIGQTYSNIEIIVVNDGSTDLSGEICANYSKKDTRIQLIKQANQGLSAARNKGLDYCSGTYIMFVDSDDWISTNTVAILLADIEQQNVQLSMCDYLKVENGDFVEPATEVNNSITVFKKEDAIRKMLLGSWWSACMKLYQASIFNNLRFPVGRTNEDYAIMIYVFEQCKMVSFNNQKLYYYLNRPDSICTSNLNIKKFDEVYNTLDVSQYVREKHPLFINEAEYNLGASLIKLILAIYNDKSEQFTFMLPKMKAILKENFNSLKRNPFMPFKQKLFLFAVRYLGKNSNVIVNNMYLYYKSK